MNILIVGGGLLGRKTAELLDAGGHTVSILDESADHLNLLSPSFSGLTSLGFPMDVKNLRAAGVEGCDAVAVVTSDDNLNIAVGQIVKNFFGVPKVIARISDPHRETVFADFGLQTVCPTNMAGDTLVSALTGSQQNQRVTFGTATVAFVIRPTGKDVRSTADLDHEPGSTVFGVIRKDGRFQLLERGQDLFLEPGDSVVYSQEID